MLEHAEYVVSDATAPPPDSAPWQAVTLPDNWHRSRPGFTGQVWYRFYVHVPPPAVARLGVFLPRNSAPAICLYVNGLEVNDNDSSVDPRMSDLQRPLLFRVAPAMLYPGNNVFHVSVRGRAISHQGLSRPIVGPEAVMNLQWETRNNHQVITVVVFAAMLLFAAWSAFQTWLAQRRDAVLFWFWITCLACGAWAVLLVWPIHIENIHLRHLVRFGLRHVYVTPLLVLCLRFGNTRNGRLEAGLWLLFAASCAAAGLLDPASHFVFAGAASVLYGALTIAFLLWLLRHQWQERNWTFYLLSLALATWIIFGGHDWLGWMGYLNYDALFLTPFAIPFLTLALSAAVIDRHLRAVRALALANQDLEQRVAEKVHEAEESYRRVEAARREQAVLRERHRIMQDMHDGLGSHLIGLRSLVRTGQGEPGTILRRLDDMLADLRAIVDSLEPVEGDLGVVLGNIRYRLRTAIEESGTALKWDVKPLPALDYLTPGTVLTIQRILLEALTNALRYAAARTVTVSAGVSDAGDAVDVVVADDGAGFDVTTTAGGKGLRNMRERAARIGIGIDVRSQPGAGTAVHLMLPLRLAAGEPSGRTAEAR